MQSDGRAMASREPGATTAPTEAGTRGDGRAAPSVPIGVPLAASRAGSRSSGWPRRGCKRVVIAPRPRPSVAAGWNTAPPRGAGWCRSPAACRSTRSRSARRWCPRRAPSRGQAAPQPRERSGGRDPSARGQRDGAHRALTSREQDRRQESNACMHESSSGWLAAAERGAGTAEQTGSCMRASFTGLRLSLIHI